MTARRGCEDVSKGGRRRHTILMTAVRGFEGYPGRRARACLPIGGRTLLLSAGDHGGTIFLVRGATAADICQAERAFVPPARRRTVTPSLAHRHQLAARIRSSLAVVPRGVVAVVAPPMRGDEHTRDRSGSSRGDEEYEHRPRRARTVQPAVEMRSVHARSRWCSSQTSPSPLGLRSLSRADSQPARAATPSDLRRRADVQTDGLTTWNLV